jgi:hypothetical protein
MRLLGVLLARAAFCCDRPGPCGGMQARGFTLQIGKLCKMQGKD